MFEFDKDKSELFFLHLIAAAQKHQLKTESHERLTAQLSKIKQLKLDNTLRRQIDLLEQRIGDVVTREGAIIRVQKQEERINRSLNDRIGFLERKLVEFKQTHNRREKSLSAVESHLENRVARRSVAKKIKSDISMLEVMYANLKESKKAPKTKLAQLSKKITSLKNKLQKLKL